ncbi:SMI1/KNR4 family protein [Roseimicrobium sp. ORNL1]|uniref:SMI1/KNR4 family protein n=1 Tax=Roseimicrobium sp. ORNL1 TaxID=2711231 RepID=UPI0013E10789|nr:SMI1/KNR4 family protein [Roseimicrobium sp. ORNL1]QIF02690.1 SMI1/KNR4 family protein [Roseimicrobium sp. ORNL1]
MDPSAFTSHIARLRSLGWTCQWHPQPVHLPLSLRSRYPWLPPDYIDFVTGLDECVSSDETRWILAPADFDLHEHHAWQHDAWETLSVESAAGDEQLVAQIREFWDAHIPISLGVGDGYSFYAIRVGDRSGVVVTGREPEFEDIAEVALSFTQFLAHLT